MARVIHNNAPPLSGEEAALRRAAQRAREVARQTHTPLVIYENGKVELRMVPDTPRTPADPEAFQAILDRVPDRPPLAGDE